MKFGSLFAGIGGFDLGLERAGMKPLWQVEKSEWCRRVLAKHWPDVVRHEDVKDCGGDNLEPVDLICGGFPCQPHSVAGKRRGSEDHRNLWPDFARIIRELNPRWVLGENVPGIRKTMLDDVLSDLERMGYSLWTADIPAVGVDARHNRRRIWIVGYSKYDGLPAAKVAEGIIQGSDKSKTGSVEASESSGSGLEPSFMEEIHSGWGGGGGGFFSWPPEPDVGRVVDGIPGRVDRLRGLGNAVVPQVVQFIGENIMRCEHERHR